MASKTVLLNAMYDQLFSFLDELVAMYPEDSDFQVFKTTLKMIKMTNPSLTATYIKEYTNQFSEQINKRDEHFFIDYSFEEYGDNVDLNIFAKLKNYFKNMSEKSKENVWKYTENIVKIANVLSSTSK